MTLKHNIMYLAALLLLAASVYVQFLAGMAGDKNWLLIAARMWIGGKKLYVDIFEVNPPLIIWIYSLPSWLALKLGLEDFHVLVFEGLCVVSFAILIATKIIAFHPEFAENRNRRLQFAALLVFVFIVDTSPAYFFDREHIFLVLTFPYILRWMPGVLRGHPAFIAGSRAIRMQTPQRVRGDTLLGEGSHETLPLPLRILIGCMAGVGFCIKPHCLIVFAGVQLIYIVRERSARILVSLENCIIYGVGLSYLFSVWHFTPEYISTVLPMAWEAYGGYKGKNSSLTFCTGAFITLCAIFVDFRLRHTSPYRKDIFYLLFVSAPFLLYGLANNGWGYTYNPLFSILEVLTCFVFWEFLALKKENAAQGLPVRQFVFGARDCMIMFAVNVGLAMINCYLVLSADCAQYAGCKMEDDMTAVLRDNNARSFGAFAIEFATWPELVRDSGVALQTRFNHLWMLPKFVTSGTAFAVKHHWILDYVANSYAHDLEYNKPDVIFVDSSPEFYTTGKKVDLSAYFSFSAYFRRQWQEYSYLGTYDYCANSPTAPAHVYARRGLARAVCRYDMYKRIDNVR